MGKINMTSFRSYWQKSSQLNLVISISSVWWTLTGDVQTWDLQFVAALHIIDQRNCMVILQHLKARYVLQVYFSKLNIMVFCADIQWLSKSHLHWPNHTMEEHDRPTDLLFAQVKTYYTKCCPFLFEFAFFPVCLFYIIFHFNRYSTFELQEGNPCFQILSF